MKPRLFKLALFLALGAIVNVSVAWGCKLAAPRKMPDRTKAAVVQQRMDNSGQWVFEQDHIWIFKSFGVRIIQADHSRTISSKRVSKSSYGNFDVPKWVAVQLQPSESYATGAIDRERRYVISAGWPFRSAWYDVEGYRNNSPQFSGGFAVQIRDRAIWLPLRPIWQGFAINTIFYATILWLLTLGPFTARRMIRAKRGHCIKCGYDLRGHSGGDKCPECGQ